MLPSDLGLPADKFTSWFPSQEDAIISAVTADERFVFLCAPPGVGKSPIYMSIAQILGGRAAFLTHTKALGIQLLDDFSSMGLVEVKGQNNYPCLYFEDGYTPEHRLPRCDDGPCHAGIDCILRDGGCHYYDRVRRAARSRLAVMPYRYWLTMQRHAEPLTLGRFDLLVCDEAHGAARELADFASISIGRSEIRTLLGLDLPRGVDDIDAWVEWASDEALPICRSRLESAKTASSMHRHGVSVVRRLSNLQTSLEDLAGARSWRRTDAPDPPAWVPGQATDWVMEESRDGIQFQPVWASGYAENYLFAGVPKVVLVSATVTRRDAVYLGIPEDRYKFLEYPSPFPRRIRPVYVVPCVSVRGGSRNPMSTGELRIWMRTIDQIIEKEIGGKGIIHAISYDRARYIKQHSRFSDFMLIHDRNSLHHTVEQFKSAPAPMILVSPSVSTGFDFPMDLCRFQIIAKIPFIDSRPAVVQARAKSDKRYLDHVAAVSVTQMVGRGVRNTRDFCRCYIIDDNWRWFYSRNKKSFARWFRQAIIPVESIHDIPDAA